ncbi:MAG: FprA family A-type flavoprotein, partial [Pygmaiobacter massiliensis]|nr:FprA family A-type flavoprotein [Pygmaiobacter massiliensis]
IAEAFRYSHIVLASVTYNLGIYPVMHNYLMDMQALHLQNRTVGIIENGSWACKSGTLMRDFIEENMRGMNVLSDGVTMASAMNENNLPDLESLANALMGSMK